jgi:hypothetical protein
MFGKTDPLETLNRDLARSRDKRDACASEVTTLTAEIAVLEARISAENDRRERERVATEIDMINTRLRVQYLAFGPIIAGMREATQTAETIIPEARELDELLLVIGTEVGNAIDGLLADLDERIEALRTGHAAPELPESPNESCELAQDNHRVLRVPEWLSRKKTIEDQCNTVAA